MENDFLTHGISSILNDMYNEGQAKPTIPTGRPTIPSGSTTSNTSSVTTGENTLWGFNALSNPRVENGKSYYILCCIMEKTDPSVREVQNAISVAQNAGRIKFGRNLVFANPLKDGDVNPPKNAQTSVFSGKFYLYARSNERPTIIDANKNLLQDSNTVYQRRIYLNCCGPVSINFSPYYIKNNNNAGISCKMTYLLLLRYSTIGSNLIGADAQNAAVEVFSKYFH